MAVGRRVIAAVLLTIGIAVAVVVARHATAVTVEGVVRTPTVGGHPLPVLGTVPGPEVLDGGWLEGARPALAGKVVLYDFWTFGCVNCQHTLPYVKAWAARYRADGLVVVGVHVPEFAYEAEPGNVRNYVERNGITYPVLLDPDMRVWTAFGVRAWPTFVLADAQGRRRRTQVGEGDYADAEAAIRTLLGVDPQSPLAAVTDR